jgi:hypothetical protein
MNTNNYEKQKERALVRKLEIIKIKGGKCEKCGYNKNISALELHHLDPSIKEFQLDSRHLSNTTFEKIIAEAEKCILVCANCHREIHHKELDSDNVDNLLAEVTSKHRTEPIKKRVVKCKYCNNEFDYVKGKKYCSKECREKDKGLDKYPTIEEINNRYSELHSWEKVAKSFGLTRKVINLIRKKHNISS